MAEATETVSAFMFMVEKKCLTYCLSLLCLTWGLFTNKIAQKKKRKIQKQQLNNDSRLLSN